MDAQQLQEAQVNLQKEIFGDSDSDIALSDRGQIDFDSDDERPLPSFKRRPSADTRDDSYTDKDKKPRKKTVRRKERAPKQPKPREEREDRPASPETCTLR